MSTEPSWPLNADADPEGFVEPGPDDESFDQAAERIRRSIVAGYFPAQAEAILHYARNGRPLPLSLAETIAASLEARLRNEPVSAGPMRGRNGNANAHFKRLRLEFERWQLVRDWLKTKSWPDNPPPEKKALAAREVWKELHPGGRIRFAGSAEQRRELRVSAEELLENYNRVQGLITQGSADAHFAAAKLPLSRWSDQGANIG